MGWAGHRWVVDTRSVYQSAPMRPSTPVTGLGVSADFFGISTRQAIRRGAITRFDNWNTNCHRSLQPRRPTRSSHTPP